MEVAPGEAEVHEQDAVAGAAARPEALQLDARRAAALLRAPGLEDGRDGVPRALRAPHVALQRVDEQVLVPAVQGQQFLQRARRDSRLAGHRHHRLAQERAQLPAHIGGDELPGRRDADVRKLRQIGLQRRSQEGQGFLIHAVPPRPTDP